MTEWLVADEQQEFSVQDVVAVVLGDDDKDGDDRDAESDDDVTELAHLISPEYKFKALEVRLKYNTVQ